MKSSNPFKKEIRYELTNAGLVVFVLIILLIGLTVSCLAQTKARPLAHTTDLNLTPRMQIATPSSIYVVNHVFNGLTITFTASVNGMVVYQEASLESLLNIVIGTPYTVTYKKSCVCEPCCDYPYRVYTQTGSNLIVPPDAYDIVYAH